MKKGFKIFFSMVAVVVFCFGSVSSLEQGPNVRFDRINMFKRGKELNGGKKFELIFKNAEEFDLMVVTLAIKILDNKIMKDIGVYKEYGGPNNDSSVDKSGDIKSDHEQWGRYLNKMHKLGKLNKEKGSFSKYGLSINCVDKESVKKLKKLIDSGSLEKKIRSYDLKEGQIKASYSDLLDRIESSLIQLKQFHDCIYKKLPDKENLKKVARSRFEEIVKLEPEMFKKLKTLYEQLCKHMKDASYYEKVGREIEKKSINELKKGNDGLNIETVEGVIEFIRSYSNVKESISKIKEEDIKLSSKLIKDVTRFIKNVKIEKLEEKNSYEFDEQVAFERSLVPFIKNLKLSREDKGYIKKEIENELKAMKKLNEEDFFRIGLKLFKTMYNDLTEKEKQNREVFVREGFLNVKENIKLFEEGLKIIK